MGQNLQLAAILAFLTREDRARLAIATKAAEKLEVLWVRRFERAIARFDDLVFHDLFHTGRYHDQYIDFLPLVLEHSFRVMEAGLRSALSDVEPAREPSRLAAPGGPRIPRSLRQLKELYDKWKHVKAPPRQVAIADKLRKAYLKRVQSVWERHGEEFRDGKDFSRAKVKRILETRGDMASARAKTIVQTETTYYYNKARRTIYDQSNDVTHYLFVAIRDRATTKWCKTRQGLVYKKGDPLLDDETAPLHWNCRSELLPLTYANPVHRRLIDDKSKQRRNNRCEPLPAGWKKR